jgi:predicted phosphodiesterase
VLAEARAAGVNEIIVGGDVFPGPMARDVFHSLRALELPVHFIRGNCDRNLTELANDGTSRGLPEQLVPLFQWHAGQLTPSELAAIASWPLTARLEAPGIGRVLFCHATPRDDNEIFTDSTPVEQISPAFADVDEPIVVCGHTHRPFDRMIRDIRVINAGSVGMPSRGKDAEWLLLSEHVEPRRTSYDLGAAAERMRGSDYPRLDEFLAAIGVTSPS